MNAYSRDRDNVDFVDKFMTLGPFAAVLSAVLQSQKNRTVSQQLNETAVNDNSHEYHIHDENCMLAKGAYVYRGYQISKDEEHELKM